MPREPPRAPTTHALLRHVTREHRSATMHPFAPARVSDWAPVPGTIGRGRLRICWHVGGDPICMPLRTPHLDVGRLSMRRMPCPRAPALDWFPRDSHRQLGANSMPRGKTPGKKWMRSPGPGSACPRAARRCWSSGARWWARRWRCAHNSASCTLGTHARSPAAQLFMLKGYVRDTNCAPPATALRRCDRAAYCATRCGSLRDGRAQGGGATSRDHRADIRRCAQGAVGGEAARAAAERGAEAGRAAGCDVRTETVAL